MTVNMKYSFLYFKRSSDIATDITHKTQNIYHVLVQNSSDVHFPRDIFGKQMVQQLSLRTPNTIASV